MAPLAQANYPNSLTAEDFLMKVFCTLLLLLSTTAVAADLKTSKVTGWISDSMCAQKHAGTPGVACVKKCIEGGSKPVFVDDQKKQVWAIDNPDAVTSHYGQHVSVVANEDNTSKSIRINGITMLANQGTAK
jgi:hypothetical protein